MIERLFEQTIALTADERGRVRELLGREPSPVELQIFDLLWSEHCSYKSSRKALKQFHTTGPTVLLGPGEDAGILRFTEWEGKRYGIVVAHESHNHPSQIVPVEGAATGIGGVVRDVICMGAELIGVLDPLRFGDPEGENAHRSRDIARGVVAGIAGYANALGVPNLGGDLCFDSSFDENCLVNVVAVGLVEEERVLPSAVPKAGLEKSYQFILVGKPTDGSGYGGATLASAVLEEDSSADRKGAVQVPDPFLKRVLNVALGELFERAAKRGIALGCKDLGAGGLSCVASEMADRSGLGVEIDLDEVPLAEPVPPYVAAVAETQERYGLAVPDQFVAETLRLFNEEYDLPSVYRGARAAVIGRFTRERVMRIREKGVIVCDAPVEAITCPVLLDRDAEEKTLASAKEASCFDGEAGEALLSMLASPNGGSAEPLFRSYDTEVQGRAVLRPGEADAALILPVPGCPVGLAVTVDGNPWYGELDPRAGGALAVAEGARNLAAVGAEPIGMTDCLNYGSPEDPAVFFQFLEGVEGIREGAAGIGLRGRPDDPIPVVSGNVSFYNQSTGGRAIAPSPILCLLGRVPDASRSPSIGLKSPGNRIVLIGERYDDLGGSLFGRIVLCIKGVRPPLLRYTEEREAIHLTGEFAGRGSARAAHDIGMGGLLTALAEMMAMSRDRTIGARIIADRFGRGLGVAERLFSESGGFLIETAPEEEETLLHLARDRGVPAFGVGTVTSDSRLRVECDAKSVVDLTGETIRSMRDGAIASLFTGI